VAKEEERLASRALHDFLNKEQKEWIEAGVNLTDILGNECRLEGAYELARVEVDKLEKL
jgi:predicted RNA-binding protein